MILVGESYSKKRKGRKPASQVSSVPGARGREQEEQSLREGKKEVFYTRKKNKSKGKEKKVVDGVGTCLTRTDWQDDVDNSGLEPFQRKSSSSPVIAVPRPSFPSQLFLALSYFLSHDHRVTHYCFPSDLIMVVIVFNPF